MPEDRGIRQSNLTMPPDQVPFMQPPAGDRLLRFVGDRVRFRLGAQDGGPGPEGWRGRLRTNLGRAGLLCQELIEAHTRSVPAAGAAWHDIPMQRGPEGWSLELPLTEPGFFSAKSFFIDPRGWQHWPDGGDIGISVHPDAYRTANTIYCAFTRLFGETRTVAAAGDRTLEAQLLKLDQLGYAAIPPSGTFRDLARRLPHIIDTLGCRILHLLPIHPVPTTLARFGRFGSPYASLDLTAIDPALVEFDRRTTGVEQFCELTCAIHLKGARVFIDIVINHTGWGSQLQESHPEWFLRGADGTFASPGAWGVTWEDLVELEHRHVALWDCIAEALLVWCRRGVDGFRCDAGYKVPLAAWQYITARVRQEFPHTIFLLEGLGGAWELTENLLTAGGLQWAYSELFQNYSPVEISGYLDHSLRKSASVGLLVNYSETHDNERLARRGRAWSLLRNRLCALTSVSGGYGFTCGVEWLAAERVNVHSCGSLSWDNPDNLVPELARLNQLLAGHPCFFDYARITRLSEPNSPVYVARRDSDEGLDTVLVLANNDVEKSWRFTLAAELAKLPGEAPVDLLGQKPPAVIQTPDGARQFVLEAGACFCLAPGEQPRGLTGAGYRRARAQAAWALAAFGKVLPVETVPNIAWRELAGLVDGNPAGILAAAPQLAAAAVQPPGGAGFDSAASLRSILASSTAGTFPQVVTWSLADVRRVLLVPPGHWLMLSDSVPFRAVLHPASRRLQHVESISVRDGHVACFPPGASAGDARLALERYGARAKNVEAAIRFLAAGPVLDSGGAKPLGIANLAVLRDIASTADAVKREAGVVERLEQPLVLLTNGLGGMARVCLDLGSVKSKYDCLLAANLHPRVPVDRHVFAKRVRVWVNADGFITPLDLRNLAAFEPGPPALWHFVANAGDGRTVEIQLTLRMLEGRNTTLLGFLRPAVNLAPAQPLPAECEVRLTVRVDVEDRNFHWETRRNGGADHHFTAHTTTLPAQNGFAFTPAPDRQLRVFTDAGSYHPQPEWSENLPHPVEQSRGQTSSGDAYSPGWFDLPLARGAGAFLAVCADPADPAPAELRRATVSAEAQEAGANPFPPEDVFGRQLLRASRAFVVRRDEGVTVVAGYPWFLDWGRDSLICARGLLAGGMIAEVRQLLLTFARFARDGTLPNTIHGDDASNRDTSDAPLWYGIVCEEAAALGGGDLYALKAAGAGRNIQQVLADIGSHYISGTPNGIRMDPQSGLIWSPSHFTWMDTNYPAATPREGYPVEIQVLWIRLLRQLERVDAPPARGRWGELARQALASFEKYFWIEERGYWADLLIAKPGQAASEAVVDNSLRSNCLFAVSLGLQTGPAARRCVAAALRHLVVPGALRSLAPLPVSPPLPVYSPQGQLLNHPPEPYWGRYEGDEDTRRKPAYHNGTAWVWTFPVFCEALARAWDGAPEAVAAARAYLGSLDRLLMTGCIGQLPEVLDGDAPHAQRGCDAQAWSVTEALRVWKFLGQVTTQPQAEPIPGVASRR